MRIAGRQRTAALLIVAAIAFGVAQPAAAREPDRSPSAKELWNTYPLHPRGERTTALPSPTAGPAQAGQAAGGGTAPASPSAGTGDGGLPAGLLALPVAAAAGGAAALLLRRRRPRAASGASPPAGPVHVVPPLRRTPPPLFASSAGTLGAGGSGPVRVAAARRTEPSRAAGQIAPPRAAAAAAEAPTAGRATVALEPSAATASPPDPARAWTAEVEWTEAGGRAGFRVVARDADGSRESTVAESVTFEWPPSEANAVQALTVAAERLEAALLAAGWAPLPPGGAWYAKRFAWQAPAPAEPAPEPAAEDPMAPPAAEPARRVEAPPDTAWWCEIEWGTALVNSRFQVVVHERGSRRGRAVGASAAKWFFMSEPDGALPEVRTEMRRLAEAVEAAGWEPAGRGAHWYSERFAWRREGPPPGHVGQAAGDASRAS